MALELLIREHDNKRDDQSTEHTSAYYQAFMRVGSFRARRDNGSVRVELFHVLIGQGHGLILCGIGDRKCAVRNRLNCPLHVRPDFPHHNDRGPYAEFCDLVLDLGCVSAERAVGLRFGEVRVSYEKSEKENPCRSFAHT